MLSGERSAVLFGTHKSPNIPADLACPEEADVRLSFPAAEKLATMSSMDDRNKKKGRQQAMPDSPNILVAIPVGRHGDIIIED